MLDCIRGAERLWLGGAGRACARDQGQALAVRGYARPWTFPIGHRLVPARGWPLALAIGNRSRERFSIPCK